MNYYWAVEKNKKFVKKCKCFGFDIDITKINRRTCHEVGYSLKYWLNLGGEGVWGRRGGEGCEGGGGGVG